MSAASSSRQAEYGPMSSPYQASEWSEEDDDEGFALSVGQVRSVARRQLIGSLAVAAVIAVIAGVTALRPSGHEAQYAAARNFPVVQKPVLVTSTERLAATINHAAEVP